jgi:cyclopropane-fatty-acyl-phospholipid synthase
MAILAETLMPVGFTSMEGEDAIAPSRHVTSMRALIAQRIFLRLCSRIEVGSLRIVLPDGTARCFEGRSGRGREIHGDMHVHDAQAFYEILSQGDWGLGWAYVFGRWESPSLYHVCLVFMLNERVFRPYVRWAKRFSPYMRRVERRSTADQSREERVRARTISQCYDVGNDFFSWVLGPSMVYTCAIWPHADATLEEAQENKLRIVTEKARIEPHHSVLDLGCGWGTLCDYVQRRTGARVKGIAFAREQVRWATEHYPNCEFEYRNYDRIEGEYDRIVCVGMAEHVGRENLVDFLRLVSDHLKPGGRFVLHTMQSYDGVLMQSGTARWTSFASVAMPNGDVPSMADLVRATMRTATMRLVHTETFGIHYARTGQAWLRNAVRHRDQIVSAYSEALYRSYVYSWSMGSAAFETGITLAHLVFEKQPYGAPYTHSLLNASSRTEDEPAQSTARRS